MPISVPVRAPAKALIFGSLGREAPLRELFKDEVRGVNRVIYDVSSKPPATIEWDVLFSNAASGL